jgi:hypothetical protein
MTTAPPQSLDPDKTALETVDAVARAAHLWIRSLYMTEIADPAERLAIAGGLVDGLCERLELTPRVRDLIAYVYTMLDGQTETTLSVAKLMLARPEASGFRKAYRRGRTEAAAIVEMLTYHGDDKAAC